MQLVDSKSLYSSLCIKSEKLSCKKSRTENSSKRLRINPQDATEVRRLSKEDQMASLVLRERTRTGQWYLDCLLRL